MPVVRGGPDATDQRDARPTRAAGAADRAQEGDEPGTDHIETIRRLERDVARYREMVDCVDGPALYVLDRVGRIATWTRSATDLLGFEADEVVARPWRILFPPESGDRQVASLLERAVAVGRADDLSERVRRDGSRFLAESSVRRILDPAGRAIGFAKIVRDVSAGKPGPSRPGARARRSANIADPIWDDELVQKRWIARELHDSVGQCLVALRIEVARMQGGSPGRRDDPALARMLSLIDQADDGLRLVIEGSRLPDLDALDLGGALDRLVGRICSAAGLEWTLEAPAGLDDLDAERALAIFRIVQEAVLNAAKHADATRVSVRLGADGTALEASVTDDGCGFELARTLEVAAVRRHFGLAAMRERALILGGWFQIETRPGSGTTVWACLPLDGDG